MQPHHLIVVRLLSIALLAEAEAIADDPELRAAFSAALAELIAGYVPSPPPENVVELFPAKRG